MEGDQVGRHEAHSGESARRSVVGVVGVVGQPDLIGSRGKPCNRAYVLSAAQRWAPGPVPCRVPRRAIAGTMPRARA